MKRLIYIISAIAALGAAVAACGDAEREYSRWVDIPAKGWAYGDTLRLVPVDTSLHDNDSLVHRGLRLGLTHTNDYPYSNLWIEVTYRGENFPIEILSTSHWRMSTDDGWGVGSGLIISMR